MVVRAVGRVVLVGIGNGGRERRAGTENRVSDQWQRTTRHQTPTASRHGSPLAEISSPGACHFSQSAGSALSSPPCSPRIVRGGNPREAPRGARWKTTRKPFTMPHPPRQSNPAGGEATQPVYLLSPGRLRYRPCCARPDGSRGLRTGTVIRIRNSKQQTGSVSVAASSSPLGFGFMVTFGSFMPGSGR